MKKNSNLIQNQRFIKKKLIENSIQKIIKDDRIDE